MSLTKPPTAAVTVDDAHATELTVPLADGRLVRLRPVHPSVGHLTPAPPRASQPSLVFLTVDRDLAPGAVDRLLDTDGQDGGAIVATIGRDLVAVGRFRRLGDSATAIVEVLVTPSLAAQGIERALHGALAVRAHDRGMTTIDAHGAAP